MIVDMSRLDGVRLVLGDRNQIADLMTILGRVEIVADKGFRLVQSASPDGPWERMRKQPRKRYVKAVKK